MEDIRVLGLCAAGLGYGTWLFASSFRTLRLRRAVEDTPRSKIRSAAMGKCELYGTAKPVKDPLIGPFSGLPCVWFRWKVEEERRNAKGGAYWTTLEEGASSEAFLLDDETGAIHVDPSGADMDSAEPISYLSGSLRLNSEPKGPAAGAWLAPGGVFSAPRRLTEWLILPDTKVLAVGVLRSADGAAADRASSPEGAEAAEAPKVLMRGRLGEPFLISIHDRETLEKNLVWSVWGRLLGGACLAVAATAVGVAFLKGS